MNCNKITWLALQVSENIETTIFVDRQQGVKNVDPAS